MHILALGAAIALASAVVTDLLVARRYKRLSRALFLERKTMTYHLDQIEEELTKKVARLSPKQQIHEVAGHLRRLRMWSRV